MLAMLDISGRKLLCQGRVSGQSNDLVLSVDDFSHPLAYVLQKGEYRIWDSLHGDARIEHVELRALLANLGQRCGMLVMPLLGRTGQPFALLALMDKSIKLQEWLVATELMTWCQLFANQLSLLRQLVCHQRESTLLREPRHHTKGIQKKKEQDLAEHLVGSSVAISRLRRQIYQASSHRLSLLIQGETGCGKEVVARLVHQNSDRAGQPWVAINCAAIPENLIESELFGYQKGAFSGAVASKRGLVAQAHGGTLFLDEVGELSLMTQAKLLRVLQERAFERLGGMETHYVDVRFITATNRDLEKMVEEETFRRDLFYRLNVFPIFLPPLSFRPEDILPLANHFIKKYALANGRSNVRLSLSVMDMLQRYTWPGNIRELENVMERAVLLLGREGLVLPQHLPPALHGSRAVVNSALTPGLIRQGLSGSLQEQLDELERASITEALEFSQGQMGKAAASLGLTERIMALRMKKYGITYKAFRPVFRKGDEE